MASRPPVRSVVFSGLLYCWWFSTILISSSHAFVSPIPTFHRSITSSRSGTVVLNAGGGFGASPSSQQNNNNSAKKKKQRSGGKTKGGILINNGINNEESDKKKNDNFEYREDEAEALLNDLASQSAKSALGRAAASNPLHGTPEADPFWELIPSLVASKFPSLTDDQLTRVAGMVEHAVSPNPQALLEDDRRLCNDPWRPQEDIHAYMPGLGPTQPFWDPAQLPLCQALKDNHDIICQEYQALLLDNANNNEDRFQSVTSMNYKAGWKTLVLFYNGHRIPDFPYHLCPTTTRLLETVPLAGRIAGFNRQRPGTGIPLHTDGNNMWLTCQMGISVPTHEHEQQAPAWIRVGPPDNKRHWNNHGDCLLYDTTYQHETFNESPTEERVVLHVDMFNTLLMTPDEIAVMQYIYHMREEFMKAEGVAKVGAQIL
eukprot:scaffold152637_cov56-Attheya_sp.AAC.1